MAAHLAHALCATSTYLSASPLSSLNCRHHQEPADVQMPFASEHHPSMGFAIPFLEFLQTNGRNYLMMKNLCWSTMGLKWDSRTLVSGTTSLMRWMYTSSALVSVMSPYVIFGNLITCSPPSNNETQIHQAPVGHDLP